jgi:AsmA protein
MKKLLYALLGLVIVLIVAIVVGPGLIDWRPRIAEAVRAQTGRELRIGELHLALVPRIHVAASDVHFANAAGMSAGDMLSVGSLSLDAELWPLVSRRLVIDQLVIKDPSVALEVDKDGRPNWAIAPSGAAPAAAPKPAESGGADGGLELGDIRIEQGQLTYRNAATGQTLAAKNVTLDASMANLASPLTLKGQMTLNDEPVSAELAVDTIDRLTHGQQAKVKLAVTTKHVTAGFDGAAQQQPVPGLTGTFDLAIASVGNLLAWLQEPLPKTQPDPGPLKIHAVFASSGTRSTLSEGSVTGTALSVKASGSLDASGPVTKLTAAVESGAIDIDHYLPPQARTPSAAKTPATAAPTAAATKEPLAAISDQPFDLAALRKLDADVKISIAGIKAMGYEVGRIAFTATARGGVLSADLAELALYGGGVKGMAKLDAAGPALGVDTAFTVDHVSLDKPARLATGEATVSGAVSANLAVKATGKSPRGLAETLQGHLAVDLGAMTVANAATQGLSGLKLDLTLPGPDKPTALKASLVYRGEKLDAEASMAPLRQLLGGGRAPAKVAVTSTLAALHYDGTLQQQPTPGIDGTLDLDVISVGKLAAWLGQPLDAKQPDPGPLKLHAVLASDGAKTELKEAAITGKAIKAAAHGTVDLSQAVVPFDARVEVQQADLNAYLPPAEKSTAKPAAQPAAQPTGWSTEPFDVAVLHKATGKAEISLAQIHYREFDITKGDITIALAKGVLTVSTDKIALAQGTIDSGATLDGSGTALALDYHASVSGVQARPLLQTFAGSDRLGGTIAFETKGKGAGKNEKELIGTLNGTGQFKVTDGAIYGINLAQTLRQVGSLGTASSQTEKTDFAELSGTYTIKDGVIDNRDLKMLAPLFRLTGAGTIPMPPKTVEYAVEAKLVATAEGQGGKDALAGVPIPIKITGTWSNPAYTIEWANVFRDMASDPERLKNMPANLGNAAKQFGVTLPAQGGTGGGASTGDILKQIPGAQPPPSGPAAPSGGAQTQPPQKPVLQLPKTLFGN